MDDVYRGEIMRAHPNFIVAGHRFARGRTIRLSRSLVMPSVTTGDYTIIALLPPRDGEFQYRVKSTLEPYERVVREDDVED
jgi:hypothetical protein